MNHSSRMILGKQVDHSPRYDPDQLCPIPRAPGRASAGIGETEEVQRIRTCLDDSDPTAAEQIEAAQA